MAFHSEMNAMLGAALVVGMMMWLWQGLGVLAGLKKVVGYCS
jgi:hypothetical protein